MDFLTKSLLFILYLSSCNCRVTDITKEEIVSLGMACSEIFYSCATGSPPRNCRCDPNCTFYGDCCFDSPHRLNMNRKRLSFQCVGHAYVVNKCSEDWDDEIFRYYCETYVNITDPLSTFAVISVTSGVSYRNHYCASCNRDTHSLNLLQMKVTCNSSTLKDINLTDLQYNKDLFKWGIWKENSKKQTEFISCEFKTIPMFQNNTRRCIPAMGKCSRNWEDEIIEKKCESYQGVIYVGDEMLPYRNVHCAVCNRASLEESKCSIVKLRTFIESANFVKLFDFSDKDEKFQCQEGKIHDPFKGKCRDLTCLPFQEMKDGKCVNKS